MQEGPYPEIAPNLLGDVVISLETARRQAKNAGIGMLDYFDQLLIHGILHLLGYDHENDKDEARKMEQKAKELLELIRDRK